MSVPLHPSLEQLRNMKEVARQFGAPNMGPVNSSGKVYGSNVPKTAATPDDLADNNTRDGTGTIIEQLLTRIETLEAVVKLKRTNTDIQTAVDAWVNNAGSAETQYGHISNWNTSEVTDISNLLSGKATFNEDLSGWDISLVTTFTDYRTGADNWSEANRFTSSALVQFEAAAAAAALAAARLYEFTTHTFTNAGITGQFGPTYSQTKLAYNNTVWASNAAFFSHATYSLGGGTGITDNDGVQTWTVPMAGTYEIEVGGAKGGNAGTMGYGGAGGWTKGRFDFEKSQQINIIVGQAGGTEGSHNIGGGGGGASWVISHPFNLSSTLYAVAGGGGGSNRNSAMGTNGGNSQANVNETTYDLANYENHYRAGTGAGWESDSYHGGYAPWSIKARRPVSGAHGGRAGFGNNGGEAYTGFIAHGGFGGGGGNGAHQGGGGGGYSGGAANHYDASSGAFGGTTRNNGNANSLFFGVSNHPNGEHGYVKITYVP